MKILLDVKLEKGRQTVLEKHKIIGEKNNNNLVFKIDNMNHHIDLKQEIFKRINEEYEFFLDIKNKKCYLKLKKENYKLDIIVEQASFEYINNSCIINYFIETDDQNMLFKIVWEEQND